MTEHLDASLDRIDKVLTELNDEVDRLVDDVVPSLRRRDRQYIRCLLRDRASQLVHRSMHEGAKLVADHVHNEEEAQC